MLVQICMNLGGGPPPEELDAINEGIIRIMGKDNPQLIGIDGGIDTR